LVISHYKCPISIPSCPSNWVISFKSISNILFYFFSMLVYRNSLSEKYNDTLSLCRCFEL